MRKKLLNGKRIGILAVLLVLFMAAGHAEEERIDASGRWRYVLEDGGAVIMGYVEEPGEELVIPSELDGYPVTGIGDKAFGWCESLSSLIIPASIIDIDYTAFDGCNDIIIIVTEGSFAEQYAEENRIPYVFATK